MSFAAAQEISALFADKQDAIMLAQQLDYIPGLTAVASGTRIYATVRDSYLLLDCRPFTYDVHKGKIYGENARFWTYEAFLLYLIDPKISFKAHTINTFKQHRRCIGHESKIIGGRQTDILYFMYGLEVSIFENNEWHNLCYAQVLGKKHIINTMITLDKADQFIHHWANLADRLREASC